MNSTIEHLKLLLKRAKAEKENAIKEYNNRIASITKAITAVENFEKSSLTINNRETETVACVDDDLENE